jgi:hypothetical protein
MNIICKVTSWILIATPEWICHFWSTIGVKTNCTFPVMGILWIISITTLEYFWTNLCVGKLVGGGPFNYSYFLLVDIANKSCQNFTVRNICWFIDSKCKHLLLCWVLISCHLTFFFYLQIHKQVICNWIFGLGKGTVNYEGESESIHN